MLLAQLLNDESANAYHAVERLLSASDLENTTHRAIYAAIGHLAAKGQHYLPPLVAKQMELDGTAKLLLFTAAEQAGYPSEWHQVTEYLYSIAAEVPTVAGVETTARMLLDTSVRRRLVNTLRSHEDASWDVTRSPLDVAASLIREVGTAGAALVQAAGPHLALEAIMADEAAFAAYLDAPDALAGYASGIRALDVALNGWEPGRVTLVAARTSMGKTLFGINIAMGIGQWRDGVSGTTVYYVSREMTEAQITRRMTFAHSGISRWELQYNRRTTPEQRERLLAAREWVGSLDVIIDDSSGPDWLDIERRIEQSIVRDRARVVVLDHIDLMSHGRQTKQNRHSEITAIMSGVKNMAIKHNLCIIALSQVGRGASNRDDGVPTLADLRESGSKEETSDNVLILHRPAYGKKHLPPDDPIRHVMEVHIEKQRDGKTGKLNLFVDLDTQRLSEQTGYSGEETFR